MRCSTLINCVHVVRGVPFATQWALAAFLLLCTGIITITVTAKAAVTVAAVALALASTPPPPLRCLALQEIAAVLKLATDVLSCPTLKPVFESLHVS